MIRVLKRHLKESLCRRWNLPYSREEIAFSLLCRIERGGPISLIDAGAHKGEFTRAITRVCGVSRGLLIEAMPQKAQRLREEFREPQFFVAECAVADKNEVMDFEVNEKDDTSSLLKIYRTLPELASVPLGEPRFLRVAARTLDAITGEAKMQSADLLKLDVQGAECLALAGAAGILKTTRMLWIEVSFKPLYENSATFFDVCRMVEKAGFILADIEPGFRAPDGELLQADALFLKK